MKKPIFHYAWIVVATGAIGTMGALGLGRFGYTVILPAMKDGLGLNYGQLGLLGTGNLIGYLVFSLLGVFLASRYGTKIVTVLSLTLMTVALMLTGLAVFMPRHWPSASPPGAFPPSWPRFPVTLRGPVWRRRPWEWSPSSSASARPWRLMWPGDWQTRRALFHTLLCLRRSSLWREQSGPCY